MRPNLVITGATGPSNWLELDYMQRAFAVGFRCTVGGSPSPNVTYKVQHAFYSGVPDVEVRLTRSTTTATLKFLAANGPNNDANGNPIAWVNHGLAAGDGLIVNGAGAPFDGQFPVASVVDSRTVTYTVTNSGATVGAPGFYVARLYVGDHPYVTGLTGSSDGSYSFPPSYVRTNITAYGAGSLTLSLNQGV